MPLRLTLTLCNCDRIRNNNNSNISIVQLFSKSLQTMGSIHALNSICPFSFVIIIIEMNAKIGPRQTSRWAWFSLSLQKLFAFFCVLFRIFPSSHSPFAKVIIILNVTSSHPSFFANKMKFTKKKQQQKKLKAFKWHENHWNIADDFIHLAKRTWNWLRILLLLRRQSNGNVENFFFEIANKRFRDTFVPSPLVWQRNHYEVKHPGVRSDPQHLFITDWRDGLFIWHDYWTVPNRN